LDLKMAVTHARTQRKQKFLYFCFDILTIYYLYFVRLPWRFQITITALSQRGGRDFPFMKGGLRGISSAICD
jgi:hypothetical protein